MTSTDRSTWCAKSTDAGRSFLRFAFRVVRLGIPTADVVASADSVGAVVELLAAVVVVTQDHILHPVLLGT